MVNRSLKVLDLSNCMIGIPGLMGLLWAYGPNPNPTANNSTLTDLDLSNNMDMFNVEGGKAIAEALARMGTLKRLYLLCFYVEDQVSRYDAFAGELVGHLCYHPKSHWPIVLSLSSGFQSLCAIEYFLTGDLSINIQSMEPLFQFMLWHHILDRVNEMTFNNVESINFYIRNLI